VAGWRERGGCDPKHLLGLYPGDEEVWDVRVELDHRWRREAGESQLVATYGNEIDCNESEMIWREASYLISKA